MRKLACSLALLLLACPAMAGIYVHFNPEYTFVDIAAGSVTVDMLADIPEDTPIIGWGLDLVQYGASAVYAPPPVIGPLFDPVFAPDGDELAGLVPPFPPPGTVWGNNVLLATITFNLVDLGYTYFEASYTTFDLTEGFIGEDGFIEPVVSGCAHIYVTPEPTALALLGLGLALVRRR